MATKRVLVIDDEDDIRAVIQGCLEEIAGWEVLTASSGEAGVVLAGTIQPDGILMDVSMPGIGGLEAFHLLKAKPQTAGIPVVFLTAKVMPEDQAQLIELGSTGVIAKPFDPLTLVDLVASRFGWLV